MSTRSKVAIKKDFGLIIAVYNHFDRLSSENPASLVQDSKSSNSIDYTN